MNIKSREFKLPSNVMLSPFPFKIFGVERTLNKGYRSVSDLTLFIIQYSLVLEIGAQKGKKMNWIILSSEYMLRMISFVENMNV